MQSRLSSPYSSFLTCKNTELSYIFIRQKQHVMPDTKWSLLATWDYSKALAKQETVPLSFYLGHSKHLTISEYLDIS